jgi:pyrroloquinoline quinone biosynthesis protein D
MSDSTHTLPHQPRLSRRFRLQYEEAQSRWVLLYPEGMVQLNDSAAEILKRCDGERHLAAIVDEGQRRGWIE